MNLFQGKMKARAINDGKDELDVLEYASAKGQYFLGFQKSNEEGVGGGIFALFSYILWGQWKFTVKYSR